jgi:hypothetical protein
MDSSQHAYLLAFLYREDAKRRSHVVKVKV